MPAECHRRWSRRRLGSTGPAKLAAYAFAVLSCHGAGVSALEADGVTTYCWGPSTGEGKAQATLGSLCPLALSLDVTATAKVQGAEIVAIAMAVSVNRYEALAATCGLAAANNEASIDAGIYFTDAADESDPVTMDAMATRIKNATLSSDSLSEWSVERGMVLQTTARQPSQSAISTYIGRVTCSGQGGSAGQATRYTFAVFGRLNRAVAASSLETIGGGVAPALALSGGQTLGLTGSQFTIAVSVIVVVLVCAGAAVVFWIRRRSRRRLKVQQCLVSPVTGESHLRFSDWTEVYATNDSLPSSILQDDCTTLAILRASVVSPKRHVADFTRDVAMWDERSSASPITPGSFILAASNCVSLSPANSFVLLESSDRVSLPLHEALHSLSDSEDERLEVDV